MRLIDADALCEALGITGTCKDCGHYRGWSCTDTIWADVCNAIIDAPTIDAEPKWIRCEERLPQKNQVVLITNGKGSVRYGQFRYTDGAHWVWKGNTLETVTAWMPPPKPYMAIEEVDDEL